MGSLTTAEIAALDEALDDEYQSWTAYDRVIADFGEVRPFIKIRDAEARDIHALSNLFSRCSVPLPAKPWPIPADHHIRGVLPQLFSGLPGVVARSFLVF